MVIPATIDKKKGNSKLTGVQVAEVLRRAAAGERNSDIAKEFQVSPTSIGRVVSGISWKGQEGSRVEGGRGTGVQHINAKLDEESVQRVRQGRKEGKCYRELAEQLSVSIRTVYNIVQGVTWKHVE